MSFMLSGQEVLSVVDRYECAPVAILFQAVGSSVEQLQAKGEDKGRLGMLLLDLVLHCINVCALRTGRLTRKAKQACEASKHARLRC